MVSVYNFRNTKSKKYTSLVYKVCTIYVPVQADIFHFPVLPLTARQTIAVAIPSPKIYANYLITLNANLNRIRPGNIGVNKAESYTHSFKAPSYA